MPLRSGAEIAAALREAESDGNRAVAERYGIDEQELTVLRRRYRGLGAGEIDAIRTRRQILFVIIGLALLGVAAYLIVPAARHAFAPSGALSVHTSPPGALVIHAGETLGETPFTREHMTVGTYPVVIEHPYAEPLQTEVEVRSGGTADYHFELQLRRARLRVLSNPTGASIELDGQDSGRITPYTFADLPAGLHTIAVSLPGRRSQRATVEVLDSAEWYGELNLIPTATLTVDTQPAGARVELLGSPRTYARGQPLPAGDYRLRISAPGYVSQELGVFLRPGAHVRESVSLTRITAPLDIQVSPANARIDIRRGSGSPRPWQPGQALPTGRLLVRARAPGHRTVTRQVDLGPAGAHLSFELEPMRVTAGEVLRDVLASGGQGPEMLIVPAGRFRMGDVDGSGYPDERPVHAVDITQPFAIGRTEVTRALFARFSGLSVADSEAQLPVTNISFAQARAFTAWLSTQTGASYRLPTEAEWEYAARAGSEGPWFFGNDALEICRYANIADLDAKAVYRSWQVVNCHDGFAGAAPVGSLAANPWGLQDVYGNAAEWVEDCWNSGYAGAPDDGSMWGGANCSTRMVRGGSWDSSPHDARSAFRNSASGPGEDRGLRLVRDL